MENDFGVTGYSGPSPKSQQTYALYLYFYKRRVDGSHIQKAMNSASRSKYKVIEKINQNLKFKLFKQIQFDYAQNGC